MDLDFDLALVLYWYPLAMVMVILTSFIVSMCSNGWCENIYWSDNFKGLCVWLMLLFDYGSMVQKQLGTVKENSELGTVGGNMEATCSDICKSHMHILCPHKFEASQSSTSKRDPSHTTSLLYLHWYHLKMLDQLFISKIFKIRSILYKTRN